MSKSQKIPMEIWEALDTQMSVQKEENKLKSSELVQREEVPGTPFMLIKHEEGPWFIAIGKYRISNEAKLEKEELIKQIHEKPWMLITIAIEAIIDYENKNIHSEIAQITKTVGTQRPS